MFLGEVLGAHSVDFVDDEEDKFIGEKRLDRVVQLYLSFNGISTLFRQVDKVKDRRTEMRNGSDGLHLDSVHFLERVIEDPGGVDGLEAEVLVVKVSDVEGFRCECVGLDIDVCTGDGFEEGGFADVGVAADDEGPGVWVNAWEATEMLTDLLEVGEGVFEAFADCSHPMYNRH